MSKHYSVTIDFSGSVEIFVDAETAQQAEQIAEEQFRNDPYYYAHKGYVGDPSAYSDYTHRVDEDGYEIEEEDI